MEEKCKKNIKIYANYEMIAYDWLFYYAISVLYITITKGMSLSDVMIISATFSIFSMLFFFMSNKIIKILKTKESIVLGNFCVMLQMLFYIFSKNIIWFIVGNFIGALGFSLKSVSEGNLIYTSLKKIGKKEEFSKINGKANARYSYINAITSAISGTLFVINNYLPLILCLIFTIISLVFSLFFSNIPEDEGDAQKRNVEIKIFKILKSSRMKALLFSAFIFSGIIAVASNLYTSILINFEIKEQYITVIACISSIFLGIGQKLSSKIQNVLKNKAIMVNLVTYGIVFTILGMIGYYNILNIFTLSIFIIILAIIGLIQGNYRIALKKYFLSFTTHYNRDKIISTYYIFEYLGQSLFLVMSSALLKVYTDSVVTIIISLTLLILSIIICVYAEGRLGLKPEEYKKEEINGYVVNDKK